MKLKKGKSDYEVPDIGYVYTLKIFTDGNEYHIDVLSSTEFQLLREKAPDLAGRPAYAAAVRGAVHVYPTPDSDYLAHLSYAPRPKTL